MMLKPDSKLSFHEIVPRISGNVLIISAVHDYRMKRRGSIQAIAEALRDAGHRVMFLSIRFSLLSKYNDDPRYTQIGQPNRIERVEGIDCFLWRTPIHPFGTRKPWLNVALTPLFWMYARWPSSGVDQLVRRSDLIIIESGLGTVLTKRIHGVKPTAVVVYRASDRLSTISQHPIVARALVKNQSLYSHFGLLGPGMAGDFAWAYPRAFVVPPGLDRSYMDGLLQNPYSTPVNAVSLGPMLFDPSFFELAAPLFPHVEFHIFGIASPPANGPGNVHYHPDIPYAETARYIRYATVGIAPYRGDADISYLADTSSKLLHYGSFGVPSVCPAAVVGRHANRFGYEPGNAASIEAALSSALAAPRLTGTARKSWADIAERLLAPADFADTALRGSVNGNQADAVAEPALLSLVVATRGRREPLRRLLLSLRMQTSSAFEIIVVDQNPVGYLDDIIEPFLNAMTIQKIESGPGLSLARNRGLAVSKGSVVAFPDDDCWYPATLVDDALRFFAVYPQFDVLLGRTVDHLGRASLNPARPSGGWVTPTNLWFSGNSNTLFVRGTVARSLRFDERLGVGAQSPYQSGEETDFVLEAMARGAQAHYCPNVTIFHDQVDQQIGRKQISRAWKYSAGFGRVLRTRYSFGYASFRVCRTFASAAVALISGHPLRAAYRVAWAAGTIRGWLF